MMSFVKSKVLRRQQVGYKADNYDKNKNNCNNNDNNYDKNGNDHNIYDTFIETIIISILIRITIKIQKINFITIQQLHIYYHNT